MPTTTRSDPRSRRRASERGTKKTSGVRRADPEATAGGDPIWYKNAVIYELHVRAFCDSNGDGIGDFNGLTSKLDYLKDLGVTAIWVLPFYPSPLRDDGYDIADYTGVNPAYGTMRDVRRFIREAHKRGLKVITELVLNHTSDQHAWFQRARQAPAGSKYRDFYVWSDTPEKYPGVRIIFQDFEASNWTWDPVAKQYYWHRFYSHQPDLNFDNPAVQRALLKVVDFWFDAGVDGMRLDAVPYLYEREGTNCENLPETHDFLRKLRAHVDGKYENRMFLAEANQWPEDAVAYFGDGDECHMNFHFPLMPRLFMAVRMEDRFPIIDILDQTPQIPENCQWANFLRNHDELTLEMVTDEERDYMYRAYADDRQARINLGIRRRLAPLLENNRRKIELMNALLFALPGSPVIYYGDEIGMGDNIYLGDRDSVRTPMQWSADRNAGFSGGNPQKLFLPIIIDPEYHYESINVDAQQRNPTSLLWWMKRMIALCKRDAVFGSGSIEFLQPENHKVVAFIREHGDSTVLVVANLSRFVQAVELDLAKYEGRTPVEMFGQTEFPPIGELPYFVTLGPHGFYWFSLQKSPGGMTAYGRTAPDGEEPVRPSISISQAPAKWMRSARFAARVEKLLADDIPHRRWFRSKAKTVRGVHIREMIPVEMGLPEDECIAVLALVDVELVDGDKETYTVPLGLGSPVHNARLFAESSPAILAEVQPKESTDHWLLYDAMVDPAFCAALLDVMRRRRRVKGASGRLVGTSNRVLRDAARAAGTTLEPHVPRVEQSNSSVVYGDQFVLKVFRKVEAGPNPDLEITRHLTEQADFTNTPAYAGGLEYRDDDGDAHTVGLLQGFVQNEGDGWRHTLDELERYYETILSLPAADGAATPPELPTMNLLALSLAEPPEDVLAVLGRSPQAAELLGRRTAEMHAALATPAGNGEAFRPEPFSQLYQRALYQSLRNSARRSLQLIRGQKSRLPETVRESGDWLLERESELMARLGEVRTVKLTGMRIRCHGDLHLGQVLWTGRDFLIIDFEGEPARALSERRLKWTPLRDVAGMLRSFQYASFTALNGLIERGIIADDAEQRTRFERWARLWQGWISASYLRSYLERINELNDRLLPGDDEGVRVLLDAWLLEKALYEVRYELNNRPDWVGIPLRGIKQILEAEQS